MSETPVPGGQPQGQQVQLQVDSSKMATSYANMIFTSTTTDEIILDFGVSVPRQGQQGQSPTIVCSLGSRVVMNWVSAKRLAVTLGNIIRQYEEQRGEIQINRGGGAPQPPAEG